MADSSLVVVGTGIKFLSHLTLEAKTYLEKSTKVLYLVNEPAMQEWLSQVNPNSESLDFLYVQYRLRTQSYQAITDYIMQEVYKKQHVCVALYGHPTVFAQSALSAVRRAKQENIFAKVLPGISSEACLFADLLIDPASHGCLSLEATDVLIHQRKLDPSCHLILWQISVIGLLEHANNHNNQTGITVLQKYLLLYYRSTQKIILYSAAIYPGFEPDIQEYCLAELHRISITRTSTLYIPPANTPSLDKSVLAELGMKLCDLTGVDE